MSNTADTLNAIKDALSPGRIGTYEQACGVTTPEDPRAIALYAWNAQVSAALFAPLHICEVVVRNAASDALQAIYGPRWPWNNTFVLSVPSIPPHRGYSPRADIQRIALQQPTTGKVIPELRFAFWEQLFTSRHDARLWNSELKRVFPNHNSMEAVFTIRGRIYSDLQIIRRLRNRIAHHEPIFTRNLANDFGQIFNLVSLRSETVASWMEGNQSASRLIASPPTFRGGKLWNPSHEEIAIAAYYRWVEHGRRSDYADEDWRAAQLKLKT